LLFEVRNHIAYMTLNRPQVHNSINPELVVEMAGAWERVNADDDIRIAIVTGAGDKAFCAGADLGRLIPLTTGARQPEDEWDRKVVSNKYSIGNAMLRGYDVYKPIIAAINGFCIAGGMELMQATDLRIAADHASFGLQEVKWALVPAGGSFPRLPRQMPFCKAMEILLTGNRIDAQEAWRLGLINYVLPAAKVMAKAEELATTIAANARSRCARSRRRSFDASGVLSMKASRSRTRSHAKCFRRRTPARVRAPSWRSAGPLTPGASGAVDGANRPHRPDNRR
jgi:enoyl-CoA hydratase